MCIKREARTVGEEQNGRESGATLCALSHTAPTPGPDNSNAHRSCMRVHRHMQAGVGWERGVGRGERLQASWSNTESNVQTTLAHGCGIL